ERVREYIVTPRIPGHVVLRILQKEGARLACEAVRGHGDLQAYRVNGRPLTRAAMVRSPARTDTVVSGLACWRLMNASAIGRPRPNERDRKSTRLNSSHVAISYA